MPKKKPNVVKLGEHWLQHTEPRPNLERNYKTFSLNIKSRNNNLVKWPNGDVIRRLRMNYNLSNLFSRVGKNPNVELPRLNENSYRIYFKGLNGGLINFSFLTC